MKKLIAVAFAFGLVLTACGSDSGGGTSTASGASFCDGANDLTEKFDALDAIEGVPDGDLFDDLVSSLKALDAPSEISDDYDTLIEGLELFANAFSDIDPENPAAAFEALSSLEGQIDDEKFQTASDNVEKYLSDECGIDTN